MDSRHGFFDIKKELMHFFDKIKNLPCVEEVKVSLKMLNQETITEILEGKNIRRKIQKLLEFRVDHLVLTTAPKALFEDSLLAELYEIKHAKCKKIKDVQSYRIAYYLHPKNRQEDDSKLQT